MNKEININSSFNYSTLAIDLDYSLVATDTLWESIILFLKSNPLRFFCLFVWVFKGKRYFKDRLAHEVLPEPALLPYRQDVLDYIDKVRSSGLPIVLATAANRRIADSIANYLGFFSSVLASDIDTNMSGNNKLKAIRAKTGDQPFGYIGDASIDIPLWEAASTAVMVHPSAGLSKRLKHHPAVEIITDSKGSGRIQTWAKCLRVHQWSKNILILIPAFMAHRILEPAIIQGLLAAFLSYSLSASSIYILNDLLDLEADRQHTAKKHRPLASGQCSIRDALLVMPLLLMTSFGIALIALPYQFIIALILYLLLTTLYSFALKKKVIADVILLSGLYTFRVVAGSIAVNVPVSSWLLAFSMFLFFSLALMKRYTDLLVAKTNQKQTKGRGYMIHDLEVVLVSGIASGHLSLLVLALYITSENITLLYKQPVLLWFLIPCLFYWITRMWLRTHRGQMQEDPIVFTFKDYVSHIVAAIVILIITLASLLNSSSIPVFKLLIP